jgi:uncharacterized membrane protein YhaH (DUF805 family)
MTFQETIAKCFSNYVTFSGRAPRSEFWWFMLFVILGNAVLNVVDSILFGRAVDGQSVSVLGALFSLAVLLPWISVSVRRLHDVDRSGWWYLLVLIPLIGTLILIFAFYIHRGTPGPNRFGADPLEGLSPNA